MKNKYKLLCVLLCTCILLSLASLSAFADTYGVMPYSDGSAAGTAEPMTPDAGTVAGSDTGGILDGASEALDSVSKGVSDAASDVLGGMDTTTGGQNTTAAPTGTDTAATDESSASFATAIVIFIIIAIAIVALVIVLVPKRKD